MKSGIGVSKNVASAIAFRLAETMIAVASGARNTNTTPTQPRPVNLCRINVNDRFDNVGRDWLWPESDWVLTSE